MRARLTSSARNPLGEQFTLSPSPLNNNTLLSYSIEPSCRRIPLLSPHERAHPPQAYLLAKQGTYFLEGQFVWSIPYFGHLRRSLGINIIGGMNNDNETIAAQFDRAGVTNYGRMDKMKFYEKLGQSFVLLGVGKPRISPSPWDALCMGVPVRHLWPHLGHLLMGSISTPFSNGTRMIQMIEPSGLLSNGA